MSRNAAAPFAQRFLSRWWRGVRTGADAWAYYAVAATVGTIHLLEVHLVDGAAGAWARRATGYAFDLSRSVEAPVTHAIGGLHSDALVAAVTVYYLAGFTYLLVAVPPLIASTGDGRLLKRTLLAYPALYLVALPFFLFHPALNPYTAFGFASPFYAVHPQLEDVYYLLTTRDNTFPSLHVGFTVVLVWRLLQSRLDLLKGAFLVHGVVLVGSVVFLRVHWVVDVVGGTAAAWAALRIADACVAPGGRLSGVGGWLDRVCARGRARRTAAFVRAETVLPRLR